MSSKEGKSKSVLPSSNNISLSNIASSSSLSSSSFTNRSFLLLIGVAILYLISTIIAPLSSSSSSSTNRLNNQNIIQSQCPPCACTCHCAAPQSSPFGKLSNEIAASSSSKESVSVSTSAAFESNLMSKALALRPSQPVYHPAPSILLRSSSSYSRFPNSPSDSAAMRQLLPNYNVNDDSFSYHRYVRAAYPPVGPELGSLLSLDQKWMDTPIAYGSPTIPARQEDDSLDKSESLRRPRCQRDTDLLQDYIYRNQHPADCKKAKLFVRRHLPGYGLFAGLGLSSNYLFLASLLGRTLIDLSPNTYFTGNCPTDNLECVFLPLSHCTAADFDNSEVCSSPQCWDSARVISIDGQSLSDYFPCAPTEFPIGRCKGPRIEKSLRQLIPDLTGDHGEHFYQTEFSRYLTRPNQFLTAFTAAKMKELNISSQIIGVHIRHGDKLEGIQFPTEAYSLVVRRMVQITGIRTVFIGSDDKSVYEELPKHVNLEQMRYVWLDDPNPIVFSADQARSKGSNTIGIHLMAQVIIFSQAAGGYAGTRTSNAGQIVYALQQNDCTKHKIDYDMYGDMFYNSWYCRNDIVHAGREWMCSITPPEKEKGLIWNFNGAKTQCQ